MTTIKKRSRWTAPAAALVAVTLLAAAVAPASAGVYGADASRTAFQHHFYRGVPSQDRSAADGMTDVVADEGAQDEAAMAYCMDRFRSYDAASGTYLGYDGAEHACP